MNKATQLVNILLVEDNAGDILLVREAMKSAKILNNLYVARDGVEALDFLQKNESINPDGIRPGLILLDLNLPRKDGREVLKDIKSDENLLSIPVVVMTSSAAEEDIARAYGLQANCYITKPVDFTQLIEAMKVIKDYWLTIVQLPDGTHHD